MGRKPKSTVRKGSLLEGFSSAFSFGVPSVGTSSDAVLSDADIGQETEERNGRGRGKGWESEYQVEHAHY